MLLVLELIVKPGADILVHRFQFDENQGKAVDEADQVGPPVVMRNANALDLQLPNGEKAVVSCIAEVDHPGQRVFCLAAWFPPFDRDPAPDEPEKLPIVLNERPGKIDAGQFFDRLLACRFRQFRIQARERRPQIANQDDFTFRHPAECSLRPESLRFVGIHAVPAERMLQILSEGFL